MNNEKVKKYNRFFYDTQHKRLLPIPYVLLTEWGMAWLAMAILGFYFGLGSFFYAVFLAGTFFYIYSKKFNATIENREEMFLVVKLREYLGIKTLKKKE